LNYIVKTKKTYRGKIILHCGFILRFINKPNISIIESIYHKYGDKRWTMFSKQTKTGNDKILAHGLISAWLYRTWSYEIWEKPVLNSLIKHCYHEKEILAQYENKTVALTKKYMHKTNWQNDKSHSCPNNTYIHVSKLIIGSISKVNPFDIFRYL